MTPEEIFERGAKLLNSKAKDYTTSGRYENFERQQQLMEWFKSDKDKCFVSVIAIKLARLATLLDKTESVNHESIEDTFIDLVNYCALWGGYRIAYSKTGEIKWSEPPIYFCPNCQAMKSSNHTCI